ncbi:hypothetical protein BKA70DRAFT_1253322 [Coprinopsis sp. MPI-PUGE-AT-0042]|nr:hypothetical protein BKA70DRAFT_1253322 [Coprinopsis sp. MPI-PUGE-AT-0042]
MNIGSCRQVRMHIKLQVYMVYVTKSPPTAKSSSSRSWCRSGGFCCGSTSRGSLGTGISSALSGSCSFQLLALSLASLPEPLPLLPATTRCRLLGLVTSLEKLLQELPCGDAITLRGIRILSQNLCSGPSTSRVSEAKALLSLTTANTGAEPSTNGDFGVALDAKRRRNTTCDLADQPGRQLVLVVEEIASIVLVIEVVPSVVLVIDVVPSVVLVDVVKGPLLEDIVLEDISSGQATSVFVVIIGEDTARSEEGCS